MRGIIFGASGGPTLVVPDGYVSGDELSSTSFHQGETFETLALTPDTCVWSWGSGDTADAFTLNIVPEPKLDALRKYVDARGWEAREFLDHGQSGRSDQREGLKALLESARRREVDAVALVKLEGIGASSGFIARSEK